MCGVKYTVPMSKVCCERSPGFEFGPTRNSVVSVRADERPPNLHVLLLFHYLNYLLESRRAI